MPFAAASSRNLAISLAPSIADTPLNAPTGQ
jgi:hypothetical protein